MYDRLPWVKVELLHARLIHLEKALEINVCKLRRILPLCVGKQMNKQEFFKVCGNV